MKGKLTVFLILMMAVECFGVEVSSWEDLQAINANSTTLGYDYVLTTDLDENSAGYDTYASLAANDGNGFDPIRTFTGTFDGQGHTISDLDINRPSENKTGLFGEANGDISNVGLVDCSVSGNNHTGGLIGMGGASFSNLYSTGSVSGNDNTGGLIGVNIGGTISNSYSDCSVSGDVDVGGLVGEVSMFATVSNSYSTGLVSGNNNVGGLVGKNADSTVSNSFWDKETSGQNTSAGGTGKTTQQMQDPFTFYNAGWDFTIWFWNSPLSNRARATPFSNKLRGRKRGGQNGYLRLRDIRGQ